MTTQRLDIRLDDDRRQKLRELAADHGTPVSELIRRLIDQAYEAKMRERRMRAARELTAMEIEEMPDPEELSRQLNETYRAGGIC